MRVLTACVLSVGVLAIVAKAERPGHVRDGKGSAVTFHKASSQPEQGLRKETLTNGQVIYVSPAPVANSMDILDAMDGDSGLNVRLSGEAMTRAGNQVAVFIGDQLAAVGPVTRDGQVALDGLTPEQADRISRAVKAQPSVPVGGPLVTVVPAGQRDGLYLVDVFVQGVESLRTYQISLLTGGGNAGRLQLESVASDTSRPDYVFGRAHVVDASSPRTGLLVGVLYDGSADASAPRYLGTYGFRPTPDANGAFRINVNFGAETIPADGENEEMTYSSGADARILVGSRTPRSEQ
jgi:hypothetical protein